MNILQRRMSLAAVALLLMIVVVVTAQIPATPEHAALMERKLAAAQEVLGGLARENFSAVEDNAQLLTLLSQEAAWNVIQTPEYRRLSEEFRGAAKQLKQAAEQQNIDAVGLAYVKLSISCIECHRHAKEQLTKTGLLPPSGPPAAIRR